MTQQAAQTANPVRARVAVIGGGPAGLMAAQQLALAGVQVDLYDAMPSVGRKFLLAGRGGMNITHAEPYSQFVTRYGASTAPLLPMLDAFGPQAVRDWVRGLGLETFVGSSGRVFPTDMKAAPLLRAWLHRLREAGVQFHMRHRWLGWRGDALLLQGPQGDVLVQADAVVLALGGGSWARLGSDGSWLPLLAARGVAVAPLQAANCGFDVDWSAHFSERHAGEPLTTVAISARGADGHSLYKQGQFVVTAGGVEGSLIYALSAALREQINADGHAAIYLDLLPDFSAERVAAEVQRPRGARSMASHLQSRLGIKGVKAGLLRECLSKEQYADGEQLAQAIKHLPLRLLRPRPIDEAISSAGGVRWDALEGCMLAAVPGVFVAGEMVDWEAPTGGYLLTACLAGGQAAARDVLRWLV
ncbi:TIGR03862 family flavoprotein [Duganella qianjiadongensis]|uniref:TIGR03862 family flavoprotein n=1 Tax=Duganella qianjiadongensis TaxID=2692176 RepID=A0ABW9VKV9_9BURK|nr:TIGR03862 family flavoprotein [Duganella qianjiadongensis]MYM39555.1 TIGR03862 family flavoprotein [Duganella qianjiadongensis]